MPCTASVFILLSYLIFEDMEQDWRVDALKYDSLQTKK
jgi:hypothetical protein